MAFNLALPLPVALNVFTVPLPDDFALEAHSMIHTAVSALFGGITYLATCLLSFLWLEHRFLFLKQISRHSNKHVLFIGMP